MADQAKSVMRWKRAIKFPARAFTLVQDSPLDEYGLFVDDNDERLTRVIHASYVAPNMALGNIQEFWFKNRSTAAHHYYYEVVHSVPSQGKTNRLWRAVNAPNEVVLEGGLSVEAHGETPFEFNADIETLEDDISSFLEPTKQFSTKSAALENWHFLNKLEYALHRLYLDIRFYTATTRNNSVVRRAGLMAGLHYFLHFFMMPVLALRPDLPKDNDITAARGIYAACPNPAIFRRSLRTKNAIDSHQIFITMVLQQYEKIVDPTAGGSVWLFFARPQSDLVIPSAEMGKYYLRNTNKITRIAWKGLKRPANKENHWNFTNLIAINDGVSSDATSKLELSTEASATIRIIDGTTSVTLNLTRADVYAIIDFAAFQNVPYGVSNILRTVVMESVPIMPPRLSSVEKLFQQETEESFALLDDGITIPRYNPNFGDENLIKMTEGYRLPRVWNMGHPDVSSGWPGRMVNADDDMSSVFTQEGMISNFDDSQSLIATPSAYPIASPSTPLPDSQTRTLSEANQQLAQENERLQAEKAQRERELAEVKRDLDALLNEIDSEFDGDQSNLIDNVSALEISVLDLKDAAKSATVLEDTVRKLRDDNARNQREINRLQLEKAEIVRRNETDARAYSKLTDEKLKDLKAEQEEQKSAWRKREKELQDRLENTNSQLEGADKDVVQQAANLFEQLRTTRQRLADLDVNYRTLQQELEEDREEQQLLEQQKNALEKENEEYRKIGGELADTLEDLNRRLKATERDLSDAKTALGTKDKRHAKELEAWKNDRLSLENEIAQMARNNRELVRENKNLSEYKLNTEGEALSLLREQLNAARQKNDEEVRLHRQELRRVNNSAEELKKQTAEEYEKELAALRAQLDAATRANDATVRNLRNELQDARKDIEEAQSRKKPIFPSADTAQLVAQNKRLQEENARLLRKLSDRPDTPGTSNSSTSDSARKSRLPRKTRIMSDPGRVNAVPEQLSEAVSREVEALNNALAMFERLDKERLTVETLRQSLQEQLNATKELLSEAQNDNEYKIIQGELERQAKRIEKNDEHAKEVQRKLDELMGACERMSDALARHDVALSKHDADIKELLGETKAVHEKERKSLDNVLEELQSLRQENENLSANVANLSGRLSDLTPIHPSYTQDLSFASPITPDTPLPTRTGTPERKTSPVETPAFDEISGPPSSMDDESYLTDDTLADISRIPNALATELQYVNRVLADLMALKIRSNEHIYSSGEVVFPSASFLKNYMTVLSDRIGREERRVLYLWSSESDIDESDDFYKFSTAAGRTSMDEIFQDLSQRHVYVRGVGQLLGWNLSSYLDTNDDIADDAQSDLLIVTDVVRTIRGDKNAAELLGLLKMYAGVNHELEFNTAALIRDMVQHARLTPVGDSGDLKTHIATELFIAVALSLTNSFGIASFLNHFWFTILPRELTTPSDITVMVKVAVWPAADPYSVSLEYTTSVFTSFLLKNVQIRIAELANVVASALLLGVERLFTFDEVDDLQRGVAQLVLTTPRGGPMRYVLDHYDSEDSWNKMQDKNTGRATVAKELHVIVESYLANHLAVDADNEASANARILRTFLEMWTSVEYLKMCETEEKLWAILSERLGLAITRANTMTELAQSGDVWSFRGFGMQVLNIRRPGGETAEGDSSLIDDVDAVENNTTMAVLEREQKDDASIFLDIFRVAHTFRDPWLAMWGDVEEYSTGTRPVMDLGLFLTVFEGLYFAYALYLLSQSSNAPPKVRDITSKEYRKLLGKKSLRFGDDLKHIPEFEKSVLELSEAMKEYLPLFIYDYGRNTRYTNVFDNAASIMKYLGDEDMEYTSFDDQLTNNRSAEEETLSSIADEVVAKIASDIERSQTQEELPGTPTPIPTPLPDFSQLTPSSLAPMALWMVDPPISDDPPPPTLTPQEEEIGLALPPLMPIAELEKITAPLPPKKKLPVPRKKLPVPRKKLPVPSQKQRIDKEKQPEKDARISQVEESRVIQRSPEQLKQMRSYPINRGLLGHKRSLSLPATVQIAEIERLFPPSSDPNRMTREELADYHRKLGMQKEAALVMAAEMRGDPVLDSDEEGASYERPNTQEIHVTQDERVSSTTITDVNAMIMQLAGLWDTLMHMLDDGVRWSMEEMERERLPEHNDATVVLGRPRSQVWLTAQAFRNAYADYVNWFMSAPKYVEMVVIPNAPSTSLGALKHRLIRQRDTLMIDKNTFLIFECLKESDVLTERVLGIYTAMNGKYEEEIRVALLHAMHTVDRLTSGIQVLNAMRDTEYIPPGPTGVYEPSHSTYSYDVLAESTVELASSSPQGPGQELARALIRVIATIHDPFIIYGGSLLVYGNPLTEEAAEVLTSPFVNIDGPWFMDKWMHQNSRREMAMVKWGTMATRWTDALRELSNYRAVLTALLEDVVAVDQLKELWWQSRIPEEAGERARVARILYSDNELGADVVPTRSESAILGALYWLRTAMQEDDQITSTASLVKRFLVFVVQQSILEYNDANRVLNPALSILRDIQYPRSTFIAGALLVHGERSAKDVQRLSQPLPDNLDSKQIEYLRRAQTHIRMQGMHVYGKWFIRRGKFNQEMHFSLFNLKLWRHEVSMFRQAARRSIYMTLYSKYVQDSGRSSAGVTKQDALGPPGERLEDMVQAQHNANDCDRRTDLRLFFADSVMRSEPWIPSIWYDEHHVLRYLTVGESIEADSLTNRQPYPASIMTASELAASWIASVPNDKVREIYQQFIGSEDEYSTSRLTTSMNAVLPLVQEISVNVSESNDRDIAKDMENIDNQGSVHPDAMELQTLLFSYMEHWNALDEHGIRVNAVMHIWETLADMASNYANIRPGAICHSNMITHEFLDFARRNRVSVATTNTRKCSVFAYKITQTPEQNAIRDAIAAGHHLDFILVSLTHNLPKLMQRARIFPNRLVPSNASVVRGMLSAKRSELANELKRVFVSYPNIESSVLAGLPLKNSSVIYDLLFDEPICTQCGIVSDLSLIKSLTLAKLQELFALIDKIAGNIAKRSIASVERNAQKPSALTSYWNTGTVTRDGEMSTHERFKNVLLLEYAPTLQKTSMLFVFRLLLSMIHPPHNTIVDTWATLNWWAKDTELPVGLAERETLDYTILRANRNRSVPRYYSWPRWLTAITRVNHKTLRDVFLSRIQTIRPRLDSLPQFMVSWVNNLETAEYATARIAHADRQPYQLWEHVFRSDGLSDQGEAISSFMSMLVNVISLLHVYPMSTDQARSRVSEYTRLWRVCQRTTAGPTRPGPVKDETLRAIMDYALDQMARNHENNKTYWPGNGNSVQDAMQTLAEFANGIPAPARQKLPAFRNVSERITLGDKESGVDALTAAVSGFINHHNMKRRSDEEIETIRTSTNAFVWDLVVYYAHRGEQAFKVYVLATFYGTNNLWPAFATPNRAAVVEDLDNWSRFVNASYGGSATTQAHMNALTWANIASNNIMAAAKRASAVAKNARGEAPSRYTRTELELYSDVSTVWQRTVGNLIEAVMRGLAPFILDYEKSSDESIRWYLEGSIVSNILAGAPSQVYSTAWVDRIRALLLLPAYTRPENAHNKPYTPIAKKTRSQRPLEELAESSTGRRGGARADETVPSMLPSVPKEITKKTTFALESSYRRRVESTEPSRPHAQSLLWNPSRVGPSSTASERTFRQRGGGKMW